MTQKIPLTLAAALVVGSVTLGANSATAGETNNNWYVDASLNLFMAGMSGDVAAKGIPAHVDASFKNIFDHLEGAAAGRATIGYQRWFVSTELSYLKLEAVVPQARLELKQWLVEPSIGYTVCDYFQAYAGTRYNNIDGAVRFNGPAGRVTTGTQQWWDPIIGANLSCPLIGKTLSLDGRFDVGGFGAGSDITWQAFPYFDWRFAKWGSFQLGYRWLGTDYETGSGANKFRYDVILQGPQVGLTAHF